VQRELTRILVFIALVIGMSVYVRQTHQKVCSERE